MRHAVTIIILILCTSISVRALQFDTLGFVTNASEPTVNDDIGDGYRVGDAWLDTGASTDLWVCLDNSAGAAEWVNITSVEMIQATYDNDGDSKIDTAAGGTELDTSGSTGFPYITAGTWTVPYIFLDEDAMGSNSDTGVPSQQSVKTYIDTAIDDFGFFDLDTATNLDISSGAITITQSAHTVGGEGDSADNLHTINGTTSNRFLYLWPQDTAEDITLLDDSGNIVTPTNDNYTIPDDAVVMLIYDGTNWRLSGTSGAGGVDTEDSGVVVVDSASNINFESNLSASDDGDGTVTVSAATGGSDTAIDLTNNGSDDISVLTRINTANDNTSVVTNNTGDEILFDFSKLIDIDDDDQLYGLIRYQSSAPSTADEKVYVDSDTNELKIYDSDAAGWVTIAGGGGGGSPTYSFSFTVPSGSHNIIAELELDDNQDFSSKIIDADSSISESGWKVFTGSVWNDMSSLSGTGIIPAGYTGNRVTKTFTSADVGEGEVYFCRFRIKQDSDDDGSFGDESWSDWTGETQEW